MNIASAVLVAVGAGAVGADWAAPLIERAAERLFDGAGQRVLARIRARLDEHADVPVNYDLEQAIRLAENTSSLMILASYRRQVEDDMIITRAARTPPFIDAARRWLYKQIGRAAELEAVANNDLVSELNQRLDALIGAPSRDEIRALLDQAEQQVYADLLAGAGEPPAEFSDFFFGRIDGEPGWSVIFLALIREALKHNPRAEIGFVTTRLAAVRVTLARLEPKIVMLQATLDDVRATIEREGALATARQEELKDGLAHHNNANRAQASIVPILYLYHDSLVSG